jgi:hypothetical protein
MIRNTISCIVTAIIMLPACSTQQVSFKQDVTPIFDANCIGCHQAPDGYGYKASGLEMDSYESLMQGTIYGPIIIAGDSRRSILNKLVEGRAGKLQSVLHSADKEPMTEEEISIIREWVDEGAPDN